MPTEFEGSLEGIQKRVSEGFQDVQRILSFPEFLKLVTRNPRRLLRSSAQYQVDMFEHFGTDRVDRFEESVERFTLFDGGFPGGADFLSGQETVQSEIYRVLKGLSEEGRTDKLILLHGPNGSSKTTVINLIFRGLEQYSRSDEGALYRFAWIFPKPQKTESRLGFSGDPNAEAGQEETFAFLDSEDVAARISCELRDSPIFLIPRDERLEFLGTALGATGDGAVEPQKVISSYYLEGDLGPKSKAIFEGLLTGYHGDWKKVVRHVQVERYFISRRFRTGAIRIDPQMHVDAGARQITADQSIEFLPPMLHNVRIIEPMGDLVDANHGALEYSDFLKRPIDMNKYLLSTVETGTVSVPGLFLDLDIVFLGSTNENHLDAFKKTIEYNSFKARMELVQVPYLLRVSDEEAIYRDVIRTMARRRPVLPHTARVAALWAVLSRLNRPDPESYEEEIRELIGRISPLEKSKLYDSGTAPASMKDDEKRRVRRAVGAMRSEYEDEVLYEGRIGPSPREMRVILNEASHRKGFPCLSPLAVLDVLEDFVKERNVYEFLNLECDGDYHDHGAFIGVVRDEYHTWVTAELEDSMDLIDVAEYDRKCNEYFSNVVAFSRGEKVANPRTGSLEPPSEAVMGAVEGLLDLKEPVEEFRTNLVGRIGAFRVDNPDAPVIYKELFPDIYASLKQDFFARRREQIEQIEEQLIRHGTDGASAILAKNRERVERSIRNMKERYGYGEEGLKEVILFVRRHRKL